MKSILDNIINIHTHKKSSHGISIVNILAQDMAVTDEFDTPVSVGLHPWHINKVAVNEVLKSIDAIASNPKVIAIGECGIDRAISISIEKQTEIFLAQNEIAIAHELPVIIHSVRSYSDLLALLKKGYNKTPWVIHGFSGNYQIAKRLVDFGAFISLGNSILKDFSKTNETLIKTPLQRVFFETDESVDEIEKIYRKAADLKGINLNEFVNHIYQNFIYCFNYEFR